MSIEQILQERSGSHCELCGSENNLSVYSVPHSASDDADHSVLLCDTCRNQIENPETADQAHWRCLNDSMWSQVPAVQVMAWRQLKNLSHEVWAQDLLDMLYLDEETLAWAEAGVTATSSNDDTAPTLDSNGNVLQDGDSVTLIKDLVVKGANFTAKRGTMVKNISLTSNPEHIEGRVNGVQIVLVANFLKKA
ncbi:PhnA domain-containing protein [Plesiomonas shigelloides]|uniref:PhnA domain-containing protein n=2 Tax=Plesiomonas shigelloides TaxID=703 RepID=A0A379CN97_PLESH|nr:alkylphosphonate utilization protein [Plesiomonas shigelloides]KAB7671948.1 PhnA domain protein [Plesiomonas shigelloides]KAB7678681.1 PhnA domain protein [Plesiomonas shigelloides]KAB7689763.1 PhnA domain protein [Plesiomonas shigelloides]MBO1107704.1 PhnA domain-containing protein [Plesiomonas shigelloides]MCX2532999.1 PhnA domain-containing protein [Plesiomonas shigelloides]